MFRLVSSKRIKYFMNENSSLTHDKNKLLVENEKLKRQLELINEDNQILRDVNDFYHKKYNDTKNIIRNLNNENPKKHIIPHKCKKCGEILNYNENLHIGVCPKCKETFK